MTSQVVSPEALFGEGSGWSMDDLSLASDLLREGSPVNGPFEIPFANGLRMVWGRNVLECPSCGGDLWERSRYRVTRPAPNMALLEHLVCCSECGPFHLYRVRFYDDSRALMYMDGRWMELSLPKEGFAGRLLRSVKAWLLGGK